MRFFLLSGFGLIAGFGWLLAGPESVEPLIRINQIGYLPEGNKVAVIADPQTGPDADLAFTAGGTYEVRRWEDDAVVFSGAPVAWNAGATHAQSGDRGWWFDFSEVRESGSYYLWDVENAVGSHRFEIDRRVYDAVLRAALKTYFYQRLGFEKTAAYAGEAWADGAAFVGPGQDTECRDVYDRDNPDTARDLRGGWMDAGDYNKYVTFAEAPVHQLLSAWEERPAAFGDANGIPESGNGLPDILDEVHFEVQWLARMQEADGGVILKMGEIDFNGGTPPSSDSRPRYYVPPCSSSTIAAAGMYAHAALVFRQFEPWQAFADELEERAEQAWAWYHANPKSENCDEQIVKAGDADRSLADQEKSAMIAAIYLHMLTGTEDYRTYIEANHLDSDVELQGWSGRWVYVPALFDAFRQYAAFGDAPVAVAEAVRAKMLQNENEAFFAWNDTDLYRAHMPDDQYHWGSNNVRANMGNASYGYITLGLEEADLEARRLRAEAMLHALMGVNPMGLVYLSNFGKFGAESSVTEFYHSWFSHGSDWDQNPAPGFVPGGPNKNYTGNYPFPEGTPPQKMYAQENGGYSQIWELTENGIYYQSAFIKLLSKFVADAPRPLDLDDADGDGVVNSFEDWFGLDPQTADTLDQRIRIEVRTGGPHLVFTRRADADPERAVPYTSSDLRNWSALEVAGAELLAEADGLATFAIPLEAAGSDSVFVRFQLVAPDGGPVTPAVGGREH